MTKACCDMQINRLYAWRAEGFDPISSIETSLTSGWTGLFKPKELARVAEPAKPSKSESSEAAAAMAQFGL